MTKVFVSVTMSLDGYIAPDGMDLDHADDPEYKDWMARWMELQSWVSNQRFFMKNLGLGEGGETGADNDVMEQTFKRTGVSVMGKRMFAGGEEYWPEEAPFHTPVFVLTHEVREPWERPGGTTFYFVHDGIDSALEQAQAVADGRDIRIAGGAETIAQYLRAGHVEELHISMAPLILGGGTALFEDVARDRVELTIDEVIDSPKVTHLFYSVS